MTVSLAGVVLAASANFEFSVAAYVKVPSPPKWGRGQGEGGAIGLEEFGAAAAQHQPATFPPHPALCPIWGARVPLRNPLQRLIRASGTMHAILFLQRRYRAHHEGTCRRWNAKLDALIHNAAMDGTDFGNAARLRVQVH